MFPAHIRGNDEKIQSVYQHSKNSAMFAEKALESAGLSSVGQLVGLLHDAGKLRQLFADYIRGRNDISKGSIDHAYAGAKYLVSLGSKDLNSKTAAVGMAHTIMSHHGLHDWLDDECDDYFDKRISKGEGYDEVLANLDEILHDININDLFEKAAAQWFDAANRIKTNDRTELAFYIGMLERFIQSALIDADRTDTADFMSGKETELPPDRQELWAAMDEQMDITLDGFKDRKDAISTLRQSISDRCAEFAQHRVGCCRLIVPTGGGKTLSSLRFAIKQCKEFGLKHIFYVAPFMSILEQNSEIISKICGDENFLEHHSNIIADMDDDTELRDYQLCTERWNKPVIATTMVQFLNALFSSKSSCVRRMHVLSDSVIIIDEVQSIPLRCTHIFSLAVNFLTKVCGSTVVLCSATQPTFDEYGLMFDERPDMIEDYQKDFEVFKRTKILPELSRYGYDTDEAAEYCKQKFEENGDLLLIVNTKKQALDMYSRLKELLSYKAYVIHLSTNMCPAHRKKRIAMLRRFLKRGLPVVCVTTQLIEAGVDISFSCVVRALAGLDNAAQAAGRCNRSGEKGRLCPVYIINFKNEKLGSLEEIKIAQGISQNIISHNKDADLLSVEQQSVFFSHLFRSYSDKLDYPAGSTTLLELLSSNIKKWEVKKKSLFGLSQSFKTAGDLFRVVDSNTKSIIVPYNLDAAGIIEKLNDDISPDETVRLLRKAQKYTVSVYTGAERNLEISISKSGAFYLDKRFYNSEYGITTENSDREILLY